MPLSTRTMAVQPSHLTKSYFLPLFILFITSGISTTHAACSKMDQQSLLSSFDIASSSLNWSSNDCCRWEGITCDMAGRVTHLLLPSKRLKGVISPSLGNLTHLTHLYLSHNILSGHLEAGFFLSLGRLQILDLSYNLLSGELPLSPPPSCIRVVDLSSNQFNGKTPSSFLQRAWNLSNLNVSNNLLKGQIPSFKCSYSPFVRSLDFSHNDFSGIIPLGLGNCSKLELFRAGFNNLLGTLPSDIHKARALEEVSLPSNKLSGTIDENIVNLTNLIILDLNFNQLSGALPLHIGKLSRLKLIILHFNNLESYLPTSLMNCSSLTELNLGYNQFEGDLSVLNFSKLTKLIKLDLKNNHFTGPLPISVYSCKSLIALRLSSNDLEGQIQHEILSLKSLSFLSLSYNRLSNVTGAMKILKDCKSLGVLILTNNFLGEEMPDGDLMVGSSGFQNLYIIGLSSCQLTGKVPVWLSKLEKLKGLDLSFNRLTGPIPGWLGTLPSLSFINLQSNFISGEFPKELCRLQALRSEKAATQTRHGVIELPVYYQSVNGSVTRLQVKYLSNMPTLIALRNNSLSGNIPRDIGQLQLLQELNIGFNKFSGNIPHQISNLRKLEILDLSRNHLSGEIPASLSSLSFLSSFSVAYNNLQGQIPLGTQLQGFNATAFEGNPGLCGSPLPNKCPKKSPGDSDTTKGREDAHDSGNGIPWLQISVSLGFIVGFWGVCGPLALSRSWRYAYFEFFSSVVDRFVR
ncbi:tyrosine-sulfated glycopeptide receptor 1-like [Pyrus ussuriensis x Pyrus communis]|uniref:Tyrosine-sulfated glycopeptide receptor 1-like n=1 Tax=Pyrus ussuriensis x Pyrus communis TaxID=2448454 RepID=A0A5N5I8Q7_9ROSA|nr:tyrosine-sulfated glycopeptide receptor 1-like [Pyrus ussuriensis x Pyrus communis]